MYKHIYLSDICHTPHAHDRYQFGSIRWSIVTLSAIGGCARSWRGICLPTHGVSQSHHWRYHIAGNIWGGKFYKFRCLQAIRESTAHLYLIKHSAKIFSLKYFPLYGMGSKIFKGIRDIEGREREGEGEKRECSRRLLKVNVLCILLSWNFVPVHYIVSIIFWHRC